MTTLEDRRIIRRRPIGRQREIRSRHRPRRTRRVGDTLRRRRIPLIVLHGVLTIRRINSARLLTGGHRIHRTKSSRRGRDHRNSDQRGDGSSHRASSTLAWLRRHVSSPSVHNGRSPAGFSGSAPRQLVSPRVLDRSSPHGAAFDTRADLLIRRRGQALSCI